MTFAQLSAAAPNTFAVALVLTGQSDLQDAGGEGAVLTRIRGRLLPFNGRFGAAGGTAVNFFCRFVIAQLQTTAAGAIDAIDYTTSAGLGHDEILWMRDVLVPGTINAQGATNDLTATIAHSLEAAWFDVDVKVKRKLDTDYQIFLIAQTVSNGASTPFDFLLGGGLRTLLMRAR